MAYVDGFLLPLPKKNVGMYRKMATLASKVWRDHGALEYRECIGDDMKIKGVKSFLKCAGCKPGETAVFAWIVYRSRSHRDAVLKKVMADKRLAAMMKPDSPPPFDAQKMAYSGFKVLVSA
jgi:uncharacterized protein YbaA (DUF1428 family)